MVVVLALTTRLGFPVLCSQLSDVYGRRDVQLLSWMVFCCFSLGCATSKSMVSL